MIVVDTNVVVAAVFGRDLSVLRRDGFWLAPPLWRSEFRSAIAGMMQNQGMPSGEAIEGYRQAERLVDDSICPRTERIVDLISTSACSAYDLEFVALAEELGVPLITNDLQLLETFPSIAVRPAEFVGSAPA